jgi:transposase
MYEAGFTFATSSKGCTPVAIVGIDVSKDDFHACLLLGSKRAKKSFPNGATGYKQLLRWLTNQKCVSPHICMEATGAYWIDLARAIYNAGATVSVVNPSRTALFARSQLRRTKTDAVDSEMLAEFCASQKPLPWTPPSSEVLELRGLLTYREHLIAQRLRLAQAASTIHLTAELQQLHDQQAEMVTAMIVAIEKQLRDVVKAHANFRAPVDALTEVRGIGFLTAVSLIAKLPANRLRSAKAAAAHVGLSPREWQSGTSVRGKTRICKTGNASLRRDLYMPALVAMRFNPILMAFAQRLREKGKPSKVIIAAVMRKLVVLAYTIIRATTQGDPIAA